MNKKIELHLGDSAEVLRGLPENSVDAVVCDPPYGLSKEPDMAEVLRHWLAGDDYKGNGGGFMGKAWDSFVPGPALWREVFRVLKPGGHVLAFAGSRTYDLMAVAIRLAGFEVRDQIMWLYGSGFPKSLDVSKAVDKRRAEDEAPARAVGEWLRAQREARGLKQKDVAALWPSETGGLTGCVANWEGGKVPKWDQWLQLKAFIGFGDEMDAEVWRLNGRKGMPGKAYQQRPDAEYSSAPGMRESWTDGKGWNGSSAKGGEGVTPEARQWQGWGTALKPAHEPVVVARKPLEGTVAANVLRFGTGAVNVDGCRVASVDAARTGNIERSDCVQTAYGTGWQKSGRTPAAGRWPANVIHDGSEEVLAAFPDAKGQQGARTGAEPSSKMGRANCYGVMDRRHESTPRVEADKFAARFFYCAKASRSERNAGLEQFPDRPGGMVSNTSGQHITRRDGGAPGPVKNSHPTVKPIALMRYLCRLVTPPGGTVLDPFMGSGSTGCAAAQEGFAFIGVELDPEYLEIARARIAHWVPEHATPEPEPVAQPVQEPANDNQPAANDNAAPAPKRGRRKPVNENQLDLLADTA